MAVVAGFMVPHPPLIIPDVGRGQQDGIQDTVEAYHRIGREIAHLKPDTIVVISPHNVMYSDYIHIRPEKKCTGNFQQFDAGHVTIDIKCDVEFVEDLCQSADGERADAVWGTLGGKEKNLDHGTMIPLYFVNQYDTEYRLVSIGISGLPLSVHYRLGQAIKKTAETLERKTVVIASGDLSHYLKKEGPYGYHKEGPEYDARIMDVMGEARFGELLEFPEGFCNQAGECGHRTFVTMAGAFDKTAVRADRLSYQGPFGVGYGICTYYAEGIATDRNFLDQYREKAAFGRKSAMEREDAYVALARKSLENYITTGKRIDIPEGLPEEMTGKKAGAFVSVHKNGDLRGCIGTIGPVQKNIAREIIENAVSAGVRDPRFPPVTAEELSQLQYSVDILGDAEAIDSMEELDVKKYGVIVTKGSRRGLLLPDLEGVDTPQQQVEIAMQKAGIRPGEKGVRLERFQVVRHGEKG